MNRYEIPTHLGVEDKAFAGLTMRQLMTVAIGLAVAYAAVDQPPAPFPVRLAIGSLVLVATLVLVLWRPAGRPVEDWMFVLLRYWSVPRIAIWRPRSVGAPRVEEPPQRYEVVLPEADASGVRPVDSLAKRGSRA